MKLAGVVIIVCFNKGEAVDAGDNVSGIFAESVKDDLKRSLANLVCGFAIPIAPSAAAKLSWPARNAKHFVFSFSSIAPRLPWPRPTLRWSATEPGIQNA